MKLNKNSVALLLVLLAGFILRIYHLNSESFWLDECISVGVAKLDIGHIILNLYRSFHPPFYYLVLHFWVGLFGGAEASTRFLSVLIGTGSIYMIYRLGRLIFSEEAGLWSALFLAVSSFHIRYSQETRMYNLAVLLALISFYFFVKLLKKRSRRDTACYVISTFLLLLTHFSAFLIILAQNIYVFTARALKKDDANAMGVRRWLMLQGILLVLCIPYIGIWMKSLARVQGGRFWLAKPAASTVAMVFRTYTGSFLLLPVFLALALLSSLGGVNYMLLDWLIAPHAILLAMSMSSASLYLAKYMIVASPPLYLLAADGIKKVRPRLIKIAVACAIIIFSTVSLSNYYLNFHKPQWREAAGFIDANARPGDTIIFNDTTSKYSIFDDYYFKRKDVTEEAFPGSITTVPYILPTMDNTEMLWNSVKGRDRVWIVLSHVRDVDGVVQGIFRRSHNLVSHKRYNVIDVYLFEKK